MADRKALVKKHEAIISALTKDIKKKKGAYKTAAEQKLAEAEAAYQEELAAFDAGGGATIHVSETTEASSESATQKPEEGEEQAKEAKPVKEADTKKEKEKGGKGGKEATKKVVEEKETKPAAENNKKVKLDFDRRDLQGMSKKDLEEECTKLQLGKKGSKEDLITRLMTFCLDNDQKEDASEDEEEEEKGKKGGKNNDKKDDSLMTEEEKKEAERLYKREQAIQKALRVLLKSKPDGVLVSAVLDELTAIGCKNFKPQMLNYQTMDEMLEDMPEYVLEYHKGPPSKRRLLA